MKVLALVLLLFMLAGCSNEYVEDTPLMFEEPEFRPVSAPQKLSVLHLTHNEFLNATRNPRVFPNLPKGHIRAGVVPHHNTAAELISGFFASLTTSYDLVIILAPNHEGDLANVVLSYKNWCVGDGIITNTAFVNHLLMAENINTAISHYRMEQDHSASILMPFINHYLPGAEVAPVLLNRRLSFNQTIYLYNHIKNWIDNSNKNILLLASIDFSHFLPIPISREKDSITKQAILSHDLRQIHEMNYYHLDSAASMIIFLMYLNGLGLSPQIVYHTDASEFLGPMLSDTTSYMIIVGVEEDKTNTVQLTFVGDIMFHQAQYNRAVRNGFDALFDDTRDILKSADLTIGNLETVFGGKFMDSVYTNIFGSYPVFSAPDAFGYALKNAGFNLLSTANNHALDQGVDGLKRNIDFLQSIGIDNFGTYKTLQERDTVLVREVNGIRFAFLAYTFGTNNHHIPTGREYLVNLLNMSLIQQDIKKAREQADFVIIKPHMGYEYEPIVRDYIQTLAKMMLEAGADIIIAGHPHVVQPFGIVDIINAQTGEARKGFIAYCLGNFMSSQTKPGTEQGVVLNLYFEAEYGFVGYSYVEITTTHHE